MGNSRRSVTVLDVQITRQSRKTHRTNLVAGSLRSFPRIAGTIKGVTSGKTNTYSQQEDSTRLYTREMALLQPYMHSKNITKRKQNKNKNKKRYFSSKRLQDVQNTG